MIKTVALVLMVTDHTGLLLAGNNEVMRLLGRGCFPLFGLAWGMNLARHAEIRQSQLNSLWAGRWSPRCRLCSSGTRGIPGIFCLPLPSRARSCGGSASRPGITPSRRLDCWSPGYPCQPPATAWPEGMLTASWLLCRAQHAQERLGYGVLWALMVLLMNMHDVSESVAGLAIALLTLMVCSSAGERVKRFWPRQFFVMFYAVHLAVLGIVVSM